MAVVDIFWAIGNDIHLLRGTTPANKTTLNQQLVLEDDSDDIHFAHEPLPADVDKVEFLPRFNGNRIGSLFKGYGVSVNTVTGEIQVEENPPAPPHLRQFLVRSIVKLKATDPADPTTARVFEISVRVHVHHAINRLWLTPSSLTIHSGTKENDNIRLTVLAEFDDGTMGDISDWPSLIWGNPTDSKITVNTTKGWLKATEIVANPVTITVEHGPLPAPAHLKSTAQVQSLPEWSEYGKRNSVRLEWVPGSGPGAERAKQATNILFLSEGFHETERGEFESIVRGIVRNLRTAPTVYPLSSKKQGLANSINYWRAFVPSQDRGISVLSEVLTTPRLDQPNQEAKGAIISALMPKKPDPSAQKWERANLVHEFGLPVRIDDDPPKDLEDQGGQQGKLSDWKELYGKDSNNSEFKANVIRDNYKDWTTYVNRYLLNEKDTAFGLALGNRPSFEGPNDHDDISFNPRRMKQEHFHQFLEKLGEQVDATWTTCVDRNLVCFVVRTDTGRPSARSDFVWVPVTSYGREGVLAEHRLKKVTKGVDTEPIQLKRIVEKREFFKTSLAVAHELGHSFGLGDEYGERDRVPIDREDEIEREIREKGNVQSLKSLRTGAAGSGLDSGKIRKSLRWLWPRIRKAGVLDKSPQSSAGKFARDVLFTFRLKQDHGKPFRRWDTVQLRRRPLVRDTKPSPWLRIWEDPVGDEVKARVLWGIEDDERMPNPGYYSEGSVLFVPASPFGEPPDPDDPTLPHAVYSLVAPAILKHMATTQGPLDAPFDNPKRTCNPEEKTEHYGKRDYITPRNLPPGFFAELPRKVRNKLRNRKYHIIGMYEGGYGYYCGVLHPGGICVMNSTTTCTRKNSKYRFCHVCRYLLVDCIDPTKHGQIDDLYAYPEPEP